MSNRWWRAYDECLQDPKLLALSDKLHRAWFSLLCIASKNAGVLPAMSTVAIELRVNIHKAAEYVTALVAVGLMDEIETGEFVPHNWSGRQFQSDVSTERVKRFRERERNVSVTPPEKAETETETEKKEDIRAVAVATRPPVGEIEQKFQRFWGDYPKREGANPRKPALNRFKQAMATTTADAIILGAQRYAAECQRLGIIRTSKVAQAITWLNQNRWEDYADATSSDQQSERQAWLAAETERVRRERQAAKERANGSDHADTGGIIKPGDAPKLLAEGPVLRPGDVGESWDPPDDQARH